jgi:hypothetical protein
VVDLLPKFTLPGATVTPKPKDTARKADIVKKSDSAGRGGIR